MRFVNQFFASTGKLGLIGGLEPETAAGLLLFDVIPSPFDQTNINEFIKRMKDAAGLSYGVNNLNTAYDFVYLMAVSSLENARVNYAKGIKEAEPTIEGWPSFTPYEGFRTLAISTSGAFNTKYNFTNLGNISTGESHHFSVSNIRSNNVASTRNIAGSGNNFRLLLLSAVSGNNRSRGLNGTNVIDNLDIISDRKGTYFMQRSSGVNLYRRNNSSTLSFTRSFLSQPSNDLLIGGYNNGFNSPEAPDHEALFAHSTFGISGVNSLTINTAIRDYMLNYGITLF